MQGAMTLRCIRHCFLTMYWGANYRRRVPKAATTPALGCQDMCRSLTRKMDMRKRLKSVVTSIAPMAFQRWNCVRKIPSVQDCGENVGDSLTRLLHPDCHGHSIVRSNMDMRAHDVDRATSAQAALLCCQSGDSRRYKKHTEHLERNKTLT